ncbi:hypothetical protein PRZ48_005135 [Zasmidium cellare]|uniref:Cell division cycle protein 123 n=1 Tax=Zasmidium cellare TaxID=395010 RepID=A0ABR0ERK3_ZASCE|nr:hypothetical protein PRZ48_005135 [Zasmidium cellare]
MASVAGPITPVRVEFIPASRSEAVLPPSVDPFRHQSANNDHNHHDLHPWGPDVHIGSAEFDALYAQANNQYLYHKWYCPELSPHMATQVIAVEPISNTVLRIIESVLNDVLTTGIDAALRTQNGKALTDFVQSTFDKAGLEAEDRIFVRLGATSTKDSFAGSLPTTKPDPLPPNPELIIRRLLTSRRCVGRLLALADQVWPADPGEALVIQKWAPDVDIRREFRVFCFEGKVTAVSQGLCWVRLGWREEDTAGFAPAITALWDQVKDHLAFDSCTMDVQMNKDSAAPNGWSVKIIEFNSFGAHLNTGANLFHWIEDADALTGRTPGITMRFVDDWEGDRVAGIRDVIALDRPVDEEPDWLVLEREVRAAYENRDQPEEKAPIFRHSTRRSDALSFSFSSVK